MIDFLEFSPHVSMSTANRDIFIYFFPINMPFFFSLLIFSFLFCCVQLLALYWIRVIRMNSFAFSPFLWWKHSCLYLVIWGTAICFSLQLYTFSPAFYESYELFIFSPTLLIFHFIIITFILVGVTRYVIMIFIFILSSLMSFHGLIGHLYICT